MYNERNYCALKKNSTVCWFFVNDVQSIAYCQLWCVLFATITSHAIMMRALHAFNCTETQETKTCKWAALFAFQFLFFIFCHLLLLYQFPFQIFMFHGHLYSRWDWFVVCDIVSSCCICLFKFQLSQLYSQCGKKEEVGSISRKKRIENHTLHTLLKSPVSS